MEVSFLNIFILKTTSIYCQRPLDCPISSQHPQRGALAPTLGTSGLVLNCKCVLLRPLLFNLLLVEMW